MLQVVKVFVAAGGLLQFAQPAQGDKSQVVKLDAVGKDVGDRHIRLKLQLAGCSLQVARRAGGLRAGGLGAS
jgi:hypothetical protein